MIIEKYKLFSRWIIAVLWIYTCSGFIFDELLPLLSPLRSVIVFLCDLSLLFIGLSVIKRRIDYLLILVFLLITGYSTVFLNGNGIISYLNGIRDFVPYLLFPAIFHYFSEDPTRKVFFRDEMLSFIPKFLMLQIPCTIYQFILYGAGDLVGGSLGHYNSGILTTMVVAGVFVLLYLRIDQQNILQSTIDHSALLIYLLPAFLNETKALFVLLILMGFFLIKIDREIFFKLLLFIPIMFVSLLFSFYLYLFFTGNTDDLLSLDYYSGIYLMNENAIEYAKFMSLTSGVSEDIPRVTKIIEGFSLLAEYARPLWGFGIGQFKGGTTLELTEFAQEYDWLLYGSVPYIFFLLIQGGFILCIWVVVWWVAQMYSVLERFQRNPQLLIISFFGFILLYNDSFRHFLMTFMLLFIFYMIDKEDSPTEQHPKNGLNNYV